MRLESVLLTSALLFGLLGGCSLKKSNPPSSAQASAEPGPSSVLECMDRCKPDGIHVYQPCYDACTNYVETREAFEAAENEWAVQKNAVGDTPP